MAAGEEVTERRFLKRLTSIISIPPLLRVSNIESQPTMQNLHMLELAKFAFVLAATATLGLLFSDKFPSAEAHYFVILGFMAGCAAVWNGILFERIFLQFFGITLILLCFFGLVGSFLPSSFSWACWLFGAFSLIPFLSLLIKSLLITTS